MYDDWGERIPQCGLRSKTPLHHRACPRLDDKTVQMNITKGHSFIALAPMHQHVLDALGFAEGIGPVFSYQDTDAVILHSKLAAAVIDTLLSMQKAMYATRLRSS